jgi:hypothetical protein
VKLEIFSEEESVLTSQDPETLSFSERCKRVVEMADAALDASE